MILLSCGTAHHTVAPWEKYPPEVLQKDYSIYRQTLEEAHPSLYWYRSKDSMDQLFDWGAQQLQDSLSETEFRKILSFVTSGISCGHTSVRPSKNFGRYLDTVRITRLFPLSLKFWNDTAVVTVNLHRTDSNLIRGTQIISIDGRTIPQIVDTLFKFIPTDGYNTTHRYQALSNRGFFGSLYSSVFGSPAQYTVQYLDSLNQLSETILKPYFPTPDTSRRRAVAPVRTVPKPSRKELKEMRRNRVRLLKLDSTNHVAMMDLHSFGRGYALKSFFRRSFRALNDNEITHLIIDVRGNGGGSVTNSTLITRYLSNHRFNVADSLFAVRKKKTFSRYIKHDFWNRLFMTFFSRRSKEGRYHFRYFEKHHFRPKRKNHFDGQVYILTGGNSFSATTLFAGELRPQDNVTIIGEETGGGAYGNSAWLIPDVTLPGTGVRFRLPLFRLVIDKEIPKNGRGVQPEILSTPTIEAIRQGVDYKLIKAMEMINQNKAATKQP